MKININNLQKQYNQEGLKELLKLEKKAIKAIKNNKSSFVYDGQEILTSYAKYLLEYLNRGK
jgi:hypothetical protein